MVIVRKCTVADLIAEPNFQELLDRYADELAIDGLPRPCADIDMYKALEKLGKMQTFAAYLDKLLIGIINVLMVKHPHYSIDIASTESFFVFKDYRRTGAGDALRHEAELYAQKLNSPALFVGAHGNIILALEGNKNYTESGRTFLRKFVNV